jgi:glycosyltransferase involved in cell wall biosynthesis
LVIKKNADELADAILKLLGSVDLRKGMGEKGKNLVESRYSAAKIAEEFIKAYTEISKDA